MATTRKAKQGSKQQDSKKQASDTKEKKKQNRKEKKPDYTPRTDRRLKREIKRQNSQDSVDKDTAEVTEREADVPAAFTPPDSHVLNSLKLFGWKVLEHATNYRDLEDENAVYAESKKDWIAFNGIKQAYITNSLKIPRDIERKFGSGWPIDMINVVSLVGSVCCEDDEETKRIRLLEAADQFFPILRERDELAYINTWVNLKTQLYLAGESLKTSLGKQLTVGFKAANKALAKRLSEVQKFSLDEIRQNPDYNYNDFITGWRNLFKTYVQNFTNETSTAVSAANVSSPSRDVQSPKKLHSSPPKVVKTAEEDGSKVPEESNQARKRKSGRREEEESEEPTALNKGGRPRVYAVPGAQRNTEHEGNDTALMGDGGEDTYYDIEGEENVPVPENVPAPSRARSEKSPKSKSWGASALGLLNGSAEKRPPKGKGLGYTPVVKKFRDNIRDPLEKTVKDINRQQQVRKKPSFFDRRESAERVSWDDDEELDSQPRSRHRSERPASSSPKKRPTQPMTPQQRKRPRVSSNGPSPYRDQRSAHGSEKRARRQVESENEIEESEVDSEGSSPLSSSTSSSPPRFKAVSPARISNVRPSPRRQVEDTSPVALPKRRRPVPWTKEEEAALEEGMEKFGSSYAEIIKNYGPKGLISNALANRTQVQLKDKARNMRYRRERDGVPLGPFKYATVYPQNRA